MKQIMRIHRRDGVTQRYRVGKKEKSKTAVAKKGGEALKFWDLKGKKGFTTSEYKIVMKGKRRFAVATSPSGIPSWRVLGKA